MQQDFDVMENVNNVAPEFNPMMALDTSQTANRYAKDDKLMVSFYSKAVMNPIKSTEAGRPIYDQKDYIKIFMPGSQLSNIDAPVTDGNYLQRFGKKYEEWKTTQKNILAGTPLSAFPQLFGNVALIAELNAMHIHTVEQLADIPDIAAQKIMGGIELRKRAGEYLEASKAGAADAEKAAMKAELESLKAQMAILVGQQTAQAAPKVTAKEK